MKHPFFVLLFLSAAVYCSAQSVPAECTTFKSGKFAYRDSSNAFINVTRSGAKQQEEDKKRKIITKFKIKWTGECEYELTQIWSNSKAKRKQNRAVTRVVITKANGNDSYEYHCACGDREDKSSGGTMVRLGE